MTKLILIVWAKKININYLPFFHYRNLRPTLRNTKVGHVGRRKLILIILDKKNFFLHVFYSCIENNFSKNALI